jgi:single-stranded DNA-binding protein
MYKNAVNLIGFLGKDAELKAAQDNSTNFTVLSLATKESWKNKQTNEWESRTEWHRILGFGDLGFLLPRSPKALTSKLRARFVAASRPSS